MKKLSDASIITTVTELFPELLGDLTSLSWLWVKAAGEIVRIEDEAELSSFVAGLAKQYRHYPEIPDCQERLFFALATQGCNREMIGKALVVARDACGLKGSFTLWRQTGSLPGRWQCWSYTRKFLSHPLCLTMGESPDQFGLARYISHICQRYQRLIKQQGAA